MFSSVAHSYDVITLQRTARPACTSSEHTMKILIVDDHPLFRAGFHAVLEQSDLAVGILERARRAGRAEYHESRSGHCRLVLLDVHLHEADGFEAVATIGRKSPGTACVMISGDEREGLAARAISAGASGFIPKSIYGRSDDRCHSHACLPVRYLSRRSS